MKRAPMKRYIVEFTSNNPSCPDQITVEAEDQAAAIRKALDGPHHVFARLYDSKTDPAGSYGTDPGQKPWAFFTVSVDEGVTIPKPRRERASPWSEDYERQ